MIRNFSRKYPCKKKKKKNITGSGRTNSMGERVFNHSFVRAVNLFTRGNP